jgi:TonB family protein
MFRIVDTRAFHGNCILSALLIATPLFNSSPFPSVLAAFVQLTPAPKGYGDSPRPFRVSRLHVTESVSGKHLLKKVEPEYPPEAQATGLEGSVIFRIVIGKDGEIKEIHLRRGKPILIAAAAKALSNWQYETFMLNGEAVEVESLVTVQFRLPGKRQ